MGGFHHAVVAITGVCAGISILLSAALIQQHLRHFTNPQVQSKIVGILWMVPIYTIDSWLSLSFKKYALYLDMFRDCYEAYVLYLFLALLVAYLGDGDERQVIALLEAQPREQRMNHVLPFKLCIGSGPVPHGAAFLKFCKFGTMQYIVLKPSCTLLALLLSAAGLYGEGTFALNRFWVYQVLIMNISVGYAFYCLGLFYVMLHDPLEKHNPVPKFLCIKAVLFLSFWQGVIIAGLVRLGLLPHMGDWTTQNVALAIQEVLICIEMMLVAFAHRYAFPVAPYLGGAPAMRRGLLDDHFAGRSAVRDFNEVMPVLLPSGFTPGLAQSIDRSGGGGRGGYMCKVGGGGGLEEGGGGGGGELPFVSSSSSSSNGMMSSSFHTGGLVTLGGMRRKEGGELLEGGGGNKRISQSLGNVASDNNNAGPFSSSPPAATTATTPPAAGTSATSAVVPAGAAGAGPPPSLEKGEALTLDKLPWRL